MKPLLATALLLSTVFTVAAIGAGKTEGSGNLVIDGIPEIPASLSERLNQYQQVRMASFQGWLGRDGALITTRFGELSQVHRVAFPLAMREQLTFFPDTVESAVPAHDGKGFLFVKDKGGGEAYQIYYQDLRKNSWCL